MKDASGCLSLITTVRGSGEVSDSTGAPGAASPAKASSPRKGLKRANLFQLKTTSAASIARPLVGALPSHFNPCRKRKVTRRRSGLIS